MTKNSLCGADRARHLKIDELSLQQRENPSTVNQLAKVLTRPSSSKRMQCSRAFCGNLINLLHFLANQKEDGDGLIQNIVTNLGEVSSKGPDRGVEKFHTS